MAGAVTSEWRAALWSDIGDKLENEYRMTGDLNHLNRNEWNTVWQERITNIVWTRTGSSNLMNDNRMTGTGWNRMNKNGLFQFDGRQPYDRNGLKPYEQERIFSKLMNFYRMTGTGWNRMNKNGLFQVQVRRQRERRHCCVVVQWGNCSSNRTTVRR